MVSGFSSRIGTTGLILVVSLMIFAFLAGGVVIHRLETAPVATSQEQEKQAEQGENDQGQSKPKHANNGHGHSKKAKPADDVEND